MNISSKKKLGKRVQTFSRLFFLVNCAWASPENEERDPQPTAAKYCFVSRQGVEKRLIDPHTPWLRE